jgi:hypothetical protein
MKISVFFSSVLTWIKIEINYVCHVSNFSIKPTNKKGKSITVLYMKVWNKIQ